MADRPGGWRQTERRRVRGAIRQRGRQSLGQYVVDWLIDHTLRRKWRTLSPSGWLILVAGFLVASAFLVLLGFQIPWLALVIWLGLLVFIYLELGA